MRGGVKPFGRRVSPAGPDVGFEEITIDVLQGRLRPFWLLPGASALQYPSLLFTMFFSSSPFSNLPYWFRKKRIA